MSKPKQQGTAWETAFVRAAQDAGLAADRLPEGGMRDAGDVWIGDTPSSELSANLYGYIDIPVMAWSRLVKSDGSRRVADGIRSVVVMSTEDFLILARRVVDDKIAFVVECKATERLNVTRALANTKRKLAAWKAGR